MIATARVEVIRGERVESFHEVDAALCLADAAPSSADETGPVVFLRSAAKPFQAVAVVACGAADRFSLGDDEVALLAASHSGEEMHTSRVGRMLGRLGLDPSALGCGVHPPFDETTRERLGSAISPLHHNCSGKHAGMLAVALHLGVPAGAYLDPEGPVQRLMRRTVAAVCGVELESVGVALDGCSAATFAVPLAAAARAYARLARPAQAPHDLRAALARVGEAMRNAPLLVAGLGRFDTRLMQAARGRLIAKGGAEGVQGVADLESGLGACLKVRDGAARAVAPATLELLAHAGSLDPGAAETLRSERSPVLTNFRGGRVGRIQAHLELVPPPIRIP
jgi:L-asparaginase II